MPFDPDAYLSGAPQPSGGAAPPSFGGFDPDAYLGDKTPPPQGNPQQGAPPVPTTLENGSQLRKEAGEQADEDSPGFTQVTAGAFGRKMAESAANLATGGQVLLPEGVGGTSLEKQYQDGVMHPKTKDSLDRLMEKPISQGWSDWKWWSANLAGNLGGVAPGLGTAAAATAVAGPIGGIAGFAGEAAVERIVPAYNAARMAGLTPDQAVRRALVDSGVSAGFAVAMGMAGKIAITGRDEITGALARPALEGILQLSAVQPGLMGAQDVTTSLLHGESPNAEQVVTDMLVGGLAGYGIHRAFIGLDRVQGLLGKERLTGEPGTPATEADIAAAAEVQRPKKIGERLAKDTEPAAPVGPPGAPEQQEGEGESELTRRAMAEPGAYAHERELTPAFTPDEVPSYFYSHVANEIESKFPESMPARDVIPRLKSLGAKDSEIEALKLQPYLQDISGNVSKRDLMATVEMNQVRVQEKEYRDPLTDPMEKANELFDHYKRMFGTGNQRQWSRIAQRQMDAAMKEGQIALAAAQKVAPKYTNHLVPGLDNNPREFVFQADLPRYNSQVIEDRARQTWEYNRESGPWEKGSEEKKRSYRESAIQDLQREDPNVFKDPLHYPDVWNNLGWSRVTFERDRDGYPSMVIHEIQSQVHQKGAKEGYRDPNALSSEEVSRRAEEIAGRLREEKDPASIKKLEGELEATKALYDQARANEAKVPELPFKSNYQDLIIKRLMQIAADRGAQRLYLVNGNDVGFRLGAETLEDSKKQLRGAVESYDKKLVGVLKHWGKKYGADFGYSRFVTPDDAVERAMEHMPPDREDQLRKMGVDLSKVGKGDMFYITLDPAVASNIRRGMAFHDTELTPRLKGGKTLSDLVQENKMPLKLARPAAKITQAFTRMFGELGINRGVTFNALPMPNEKWRGRVRDDFDPLTGNYIVDVNTSRILTEHDLYAAMSHEAGHVIMHNAFMTATDRVQAPVFEAYRKERAARYASGADPTVEMVRRLRDNAISLTTGARAMHDGYRLSDLDPKSKDYFLGFEEWFAEQVAKYMTTDTKPLGIVGQFFKKLANKITDMLKRFWKLEGPGAGKPSDAVRDFLDNRWGMPSGWVEPIKEQFERDTKLKAQAAFDKEGAPETTAAPMQASTAGGRNILSHVPDAKDGEAMAAHGDRMNWFMDKFLSLPQIADLNKHIPQLATYTDMHRIAARQFNDITQEAYARVQQWGMIRNKEDLANLTHAIDDYANGRFKLPHTEDGIFRRPLPEEMAALVKKHKLTSQSLKLFNDLTNDYDNFLERYRTVLTNEAMKIKDDAQRINNLTNINSRIDKYKKQPFMPLTRFGKYLITVYSKDGTIRHSEQTNSLRQQRKIVEALKKSPDLMPGDDVLPGMVPKDAAPFLGMPPGLLNLIQDKLSLSQSQRSVLDQLQFDYSPGHSFKHQFSDQDRVPGYSTDFLRNYANFFFHGARHLTRITWVDQMRDQINSLSSLAERRARAGNPDGANKLDKITKYMQDHFDAWVNPKNDWATLRGLAFHWYLGFNPASAAVNLTQTPLMTYPFLAGKYGDFRAAKAMLKASTDLNNFYKKGTLLSRGEVGENTPANFYARALAELVKRGSISETQAHQLAAISQDRNILRQFGKSGEAAWLKFSEASGWMFDLTEQWNRRLAARAALELAYTRPNSKHVQEAIAASPLTFRELTAKEDQGGLNWTKQEAGAFLAAQDAINHTQFEYGQYARPRFMRSALGSSLMVFKLFTQNTLFNLVSNPAMLARWMVVMGAMGGMQGLLGFDNVNSLLKTIAYRIFGKDFDLEDEARHAVRNFTDETWAPDLLMHGLAAKGFGIPQVMHSIGMNAFPTMDVSKNIGFGDVLPADPFKPLGPVRDPTKETYKQIERAAGAVFGLPLSVYDFSTASANFSDLKKYQALMPRWAANLTAAYRWWSQGKEVNRAGNPVIRFNTADTEQMSEILARAMGFQPRRLTEEWQRIMATSDASAYWDLSRQDLIRQFAESIKSNDQDSKQRVLEAIKQFNQNLPPEARGKAITSKGLQASVTQRLRVQSLQERGLPPKKSDIPLAQDVEKYYPRGWPRDQVSSKVVQ